MKAMTVEPMTVAQICMYTGKDALYDFNGYKARIMNASKGQMIDIDVMMFMDKKWWGLRKLKDTTGKSYQYLAFLVDPTTKQV